MGTNLENLEYSRIPLNMENAGNSVNSVQPQGKIVTNKVLLVHQSYGMTEVTTDTIIGGGSYWAGRAAARPLFYPCGLPMCLACPLLSTFCPANTLCFVVLLKYFLYFITLPTKLHCVLSKYKTTINSKIHLRLYVVIFVQ